MAPKVTAKVVCTKKDESGEGDDRRASVMFLADYAEGRNAEWAAATPTLSVGMTVNGRAADLFEEGKRYTLTFDEDEAEAADVPAGVGG